MGEIHLVIIIAIGRLRRRAKDVQRYFHVCSRKTGTASEIEHIVHQDVLVE